MSRGLFALAALILVAAGPAVAPAVADWAFPATPAAPPPGGWDAVTPRHVPGSTRIYTDAQLHDLQHAVDWFPARHPAMPAVVADGRAPAVKACAFCHLPRGGGRPENASLAGLPAAYIVAQVAAFADGSRGAAVPAWRPTAAMTETAKAASPADLAAAARYFAALPFVSRVRVVETATVPQMQAQAFILVPARGGMRELIGTRVVETPRDVERFERRDPTVGSIAYVPPGSLVRGALVTARFGCPTCHQAAMKGWGAGRSPSYIVRQLLAFRSGARHDAEAGPMQAVAAQLGDADIVAVAAYWASLQP